MKLFFVYGLKRDGNIFYVGFTSNLTRRFLEHKRNFDGDIELVKLDEIIGDRQDAEFSEQKHIYNLGLINSPLFNKNVSILEHNCKECGGRISQLSGKRKKEFCSSSCRSNFWQKNKRRSVIVENKNKTSTTIKNVVISPAQNESIDNRKPFMSDAIKKKLGL